MVKNEGTLFGLKQRYWWLIPLVIGLAIALFSPTDILKYTIAKTIVGAMSSIVPMIRKINGAYEFAQIAQFYFSIMWMTTPITYMSMGTSVHLDMGRIIKSCKKNKKNKILSTFGCLILWPMAILFAFFWGLDPLDLDSKYAVVLHTRLGMGTLGFCLVHAVPMLLRLIVIWIQNFRRIFA